MVTLALDAPATEKEAVNATIRKESPRLQVLLPEHANWLVAKETLHAHMPYSITARCGLFSERFPGEQINCSNLRKLYRCYGIKKRVVRYTLEHTPKKRLQIKKERQERLPRILRHVDQGHNVLFLDEAVFTSNQIRTSVWCRRGHDSAHIPKANLGFKAVAVVAAIDMEGNLLGLTLADKSIRYDAFVEFLESCYQQHKTSRWTFLMLDNLRLHHNKSIRSLCHHMRYSLRFNSSYSPVFNPIESLWAYAKRDFARHCITEVNFEDQDHVRGLVRRSIEGVPREYLRKNVRRSVHAMREAVEQDEKE
jgi:transposase